VTAAGKTSFLFSILYIESLADLTRLIQRNVADGPIQLLTIACLQSKVAFLEGRLFSSQSGLFENLSDCYN